MSYVLRLYVEPDVASNIKDLYKTSATAWPKPVHFDAGVDLFVPDTLVVAPHSLSVKVNHQIRCSMYDEVTGQPVCYYLYCRSSTGSKTPLRLANSVGIIDSGYRGHITGVFDHLGDTAYTINAKDRLLQLCGPTLDRPIRVVVVDTLDQLGAPTERGTNGFGSTGQ